ncbi:MAG: TolC family protein [Bacteroidales bacterium]|nr:TolC family protein [Bacteroidales bacterium]
MKQLFISRKMILATFILLSFLAFSSLRAQDTLKIDLNTALKIALSENPTVKVADKEIQKKKYAQKGAYASLFPQINFGGDYNRTIKKQVMYMDFPGLGDLGEGNQGDGTGSSNNATLRNTATDNNKNDALDTSNGFEVGRSNNWNVGFNASLPLVNASLWRSLDISGMDVELSVEQARSSKISMVNEVKKAFYGVLLAKDSYNVLKASYDNAMVNYLDIKKKFAQGTVAEYDLIRASVRVNNVEPNLLEAENSVKLAKWQLKALMGMDLDEVIDCNGSLTDFETELYSDFLATDTSLVNNTDLIQMDLQTKLLEKTLSMYKADFYPTLSASFFYQWNAMNNDFRFKNYQWNPYSVVGVSLSIPLFTGGSRYHKLKETNVSIDQIKLQRENTERNLQLAVRQSIDQMNTCVKKFGATQRGVEEAEKGYMIAQKRYDTGAGTLLELNDAELALTQSRLNFNQAIYEYVTSKSNLEKILGEQK